MTALSSPIMIQMVLCLAGVRSGHGREPHQAFLRVPPNNWGRGKIVRAVDEGQQLCSRGATLKSFVGFCYLLVGQVEQAHCWAMAAIRDNPHSFIAHYYLARLHSYFGEADLAFREFAICYTNCRVGTVLLWY